MRNRREQRRPHRLGRLEARQGQYHLARCESVSEPLSRPPFGRLFGSYTLNELGDSAGLVALALLVYEESGDAAATGGFSLLRDSFLPSSPRRSRHGSTSSISGARSDVFT